MLRYFLKISVLLISWWGVAPSSAGAADQGMDLRESQVKAAFIYNFALYVEWPTGAGGEQKPHTVCLIGANNFGPTLEAIRGKLVRNRSLVLRRIVAAEDAGGCDILFVSSSERINLHSILDAVRNLPVLTISDMERFTRSGGMIGLLALDNKVQFEVNLKQAQRSQLRISSQLLKLARDVIE